MIDTPLSEAASPAPATEVRFAPGAHPETDTLVRLESFDGPLALLLALIEQRRLDVVTVRLGELAEAYLEALANLRDDRLGHISTFVSVCSQLILIKSRAILPAPPPAELPLEETSVDPEEELRRRLIAYRAYRDAGRDLAARLESGVSLFHREPGRAAASALAGARPGTEPTLDPVILAAALTSALHLVPPPEPPPQIVPRSVTLAERAAAIRAALREAPAVVLQELLAGVRDRVVLAVTFLALLELVKRRELTVEQERPWGPILCRRIP